MKLGLSKRIKLVGGIIIAVLLIASGTIYGLAKFGVINVKFLADQVSPDVGYWVEPVDNNNQHIDLSPGTNVTAYPVDSSFQGAGTSKTVLTEQKTGIDGTGRTITKNVGLLTLSANTDYYFVVLCSSGQRSTPIRANSNFHGTSFFDPLVFAPICTGGESGDNPGQNTLNYIFEGKTKDGDVLLPGVNISVVKKEAAGDAKIVPDFQSVSSSTRYGTAGNNYQSAPYSLPGNTQNALDDVYISFTKSGYWTDTPIMKLQDAGTIANTNDSISGGIETITVTIKQINFYTGSLKYRFTGRVNDTNGVALSGVEVSIYDVATQAGLVDPKLKTSGSGTNNYQMISGYINRSDLTGINISFSKTGFSDIDWPVSDPGIIKSQRVVGSGSNAFTLVTIKDCVMIAQSELLDVQAFVTREGNNVPLEGFEISVECPHNPSSLYQACKDLPFEDTVSKQTIATAQTTHSKKQNYLVTYGYNIAKANSAVPFLELHLHNKGIFYYDADGSNSLNNDESLSEQIIQIKQSDVKPPADGNPNSYVHFDIVLKAGPSGVHITGHVYDVENKQPVSGASVALQKNDGSLEYLPLAQATTNAVGEYDITFVLPGALRQYNIRAFHKDYSDDAKAKISLNLDPFISYTSPKTDFYLNKCYH